MKPDIFARIIASACLVVFCTLSICAQAPVPPPNYRVLDLGTLGGSLSIAFGLNDRGRVEGYSTPVGDTSVHAFLWQDGVMIDLGTLGGPNSQAFFGPNERGQVAGVSELSTPDPNGEDFCGFSTHLSCVPFLWQSGLMQPLPILGGNNGQANGINDRGEVAGWTETDDRDPSCPRSQVLQFKPVIWLQGKAHELPSFVREQDGIAYSVNARGQVVGGSGSCVAFDPDYGAPLQPKHALMWQNGTVLDLGNLGGAINNIAFTINNAGEVGGTSGLPGDQANHAFRWQNGVMTDLGVLSGDVDSGALGVSGGKVVGGSFDANGNSRAFLWQNGVMTDLNDLISDGPPLFLLQASAINSEGQIAGFAIRTDTGEVHAFLATPNHENAPASQTGRIKPSLRVMIPENIRELLQGHVRLGGIGSLARHSR